MGRNPSRFEGDNLPVKQVFWNNCKEFVRKLNVKEGGNKYRLPTEAEWEYACRAGTTTLFYTGRCLSSTHANYKGFPAPGCSKGINRDKAIKVASLSPNVWGLYDMHGNVREWCEDRYGDYPSGHVTDPEGPSSGSYRVIRGGSWFNYAWMCRAAFRSHKNPYRSDYRLGLRLARTH